MLLSVTTLLEGATTRKEEAARPSSWLLWQYSEAGGMVIPPNYLNTERRDLGQPSWDRGNVPLYPGQLGGLRKGMENWANRVEGQTNTDPPSP